MEILIGIIGSGLASWWITHAYYKKSLKQQADESQKEIHKILSVLEKQQNNNNRELFMARILDESIQEYRNAGTPVRVLDSYDSLTNEEKADLYDKVILRVKGRPGKSNKYRIK